jgi:hypothetical protein
MWSTRNIFSRLKPFARASLTTFCVSTLLGSFTAAAHAETFGRTTIGVTPSGSLRADFKRGSKFTLAEAGTATSLCAYIDGNGTTNFGSPDQTLRLVMYRDVNGSPGAKLAESSEFRVYEGFPAQWKCLDIGWTPVTAGAYWLMIHTGRPDSAGPARYYYDGAANYVANADNYLDGSADPAGTVASGNGTLSIYASYTPATRVQHTGVMTPGPTPSGGLRADFKRGSSITFPQAGKVTALSAYLDGFGGGSEISQQIQLALYEDVNGVPGKLVTQSGARSILNGTHGRWFTFATPEGNVHAGKYWLMVHTGSAAGVVRYFYQGTGNWFGNMDAFGDGSSNPFGTAGAGNGTISAYASYQPGASLPDTLGYTTIGGFIEKNFGESYIEGSRFRLVKSGATFTSLHAYLDGLGGASGSQQARMALFSDNGGFANELMAVSSVVNIPAGQAPGWVTFNIPATALPPGYYWIAMHTGPTAGIVRRYLDHGVGESEYNHEDPFADGTNGFVNSDGEIASDSELLSVYATFHTN